MTPRAAGARRGRLLSGCLAAAAVVPVMLAIATPSSAARNPEAAPLSRWGPVPPGVTAQWPTAGQNIFNSHSNMFERDISSSNVSKLRLAYTITTHGDVSATPAVVGGYIYFPDWGGYLTKADLKTGEIIWSYPISDYNGIPGSVSRNTPAVSGNIAVIGDQNAPEGGAGTRLMAVSTVTGHLIWVTKLAPDFAAALTSSPVIYHGVIYEGISSREEIVATIPTYKCCTYRGSVVAVSLKTGKILWRAYTVPANGGVPGGYSGGPIWSSTAAIDPAHHLLFTTTGNNYSQPADVTACQQAGNPASQCLSPDDHIDSIVALDMRTGAIRWTAGLHQFDDWNAACLPNYPHNNCPVDPGDDGDFADGPHVFFVREPGGKRLEVVGAGQKTGVYWEVNALTGQILWSSAVGPGGNHGGMQWGTATDGKRIYIADTNSDKVPYTLRDGQTITSGLFAAVSPVTGDVLWQTPDPTGNEDQSAVTVANGVMYAGSMSGYMYAIDAATGKILWSYHGQGSSNASPAVVGDHVLWGNGYDRFGEGTGSTTFYVFTLPERRMSRNSPSSGASAASPARRG